MFNIKEFEASFSMLYYTFNNFILHGNSGYIVSLHCRECALKDGCFIRNYRSDPAIYSILPAPKEQPCTQFSIKKSFKPFFQRIILLGKSVYSVRLHFKECALKDGCFIRRYRNDPVMYSTLPTTNKQPCTLRSIYKIFKQVFQRFFLHWKYA